MSKRNIIEEVKVIHRRHRPTNADVAEYTRTAMQITRLWQEEVCQKNIKAEVRVSENNNEKIDIVDLGSKLAYELKVSGKNPHHEFYKDIVKVLTYNEYHSGKDRIKKLVFITESNGIDSLNRRLDVKFLQLLKGVHQLDIELIKI